MRIRSALLATSLFTMAVFPALAEERTYVLDASAAASDDGVWKDVETGLHALLPEGGRIIISRATGTITVGGVKNGQEISAYIDAINKVLRHQVTTTVTAYLVDLPPALASQGSGRAPIAVVDESVAANIGHELGMEGHVTDWKQIALVSRNNTVLSAHSGFLSVKVQPHALESNVALDYALNVSVPSLAGGDTTVELPGEVLIAPGKAVVFTRFESGREVVAILQSNDLARAD